MSNRYVRAYANAALESATPTQLLSQLYARLVRDIDEADAKIVAGDPAGKGVAINHAHSIVTELMTTLNPKLAPDLCAQLASLYGFVLRELVLANAKMCRKHLAEAKKVVLTLQDAFDEAILSLSGAVSIPQAAAMAQLR